jgi:hypothetical protein
MKSYKYTGNLLLVLCVTLLMSTGCNRYQYLFIDSTLPRNNLNEFVVDNDTVSIRYNYSEANLKISMSVYNKLMKPLYIDYLRSAIIINNEQLNGPIYDENQPGFIAPLSFVRVKSIPLRFSPFDSGSPEDSKEVSMGSGKGKKLTYDKNTTPFHFRNILAITENDDYSSATFYDYSFWISDLIESGTKPSSVADRADQSYINKSAKSNFWLAYSGIILATLLIPLMILAAAG